MHQNGLLQRRAGKNSNGRGTHLVPTVELVRDTTLGSVEEADRCVMP
jgi:hypothetical protein